MYPTTDLYYFVTNVAHWERKSKIKLLPSLIQLVKETQNQQAEFIVTRHPTTNPLTSTVRLVCSMQHSSDT